MTLMCVCSPAWRRKSVCLNLPTFYEWLTNPNFCGSEGFKPWPKQVFVLGSIFEEICPMPTCTDSRFFETMFNCGLDELQERVTFLEFGRCPSCGASKSELYQEGHVHLVDDVSLCLGQRSSKTSMIAGFAGTYVVHRILSIPDIPKHYGLKPNQKIYGTFVAQTKEQAIKYPWADFFETYNGSTWFKEYNAALTQIAEEEGWEVRPVKVRDTFIEYRHKQVYVGCHGPNKRTLRGATRFFGGIDEYGWFSQDDGRETASANETVDALKNALLTLRSATRRQVERGWDEPINIMCAKTSSPSHVGDPILTAVQKGRYLQKSFVLHAATWEFNPTITRADLDDDFILHPEHAMRSFGAVPPLANDPFHSNPAVFKTLPRDFEPLFDHTVEVYIDKSGLRYICPKLGVLPKDDGIPRVISVDPGETNNSFGISLLHLEPNGDPMLDAAIALAPRRTENGAILRVHFQQTLEQCIFPLLERFNVIAVLYDRWQSISHIQQIRDHDIFAERSLAVQKANPKMVEGRDKTPTIGGAYQQTLRYKDFLNFDARLPNLRMPRLEKPFDTVREDLEEALSDAPILSLLFQIATVRTTGAKVTKPSQGDDDLYRSMVNGIIYMVEENRMPIFTDHSGARLQKRKSSRTRWVMARRSDRTGGSGASMGKRSKVGVVRGTSSAHFGRKR